MMPFRDVAPDLHVLLRPLVDLEPHLPAVEGYYSGMTDTALVGLQLRRRLVDRIGAGWLIALVGECGLPLLTPDEYEPLMREAFYGQHLPGYEHHIRVDHAAAPAGVGLVEHVIDGLWQRLEGSGAVATPDAPHVPAFSPTPRLLDAPEAPEPPASFEPSEPSAVFEFSDFLESSSIFDASEFWERTGPPRPVTEAGRPGSEWELIS